METEQDTSVWYLRFRCKGIFTRSREWRWCKKVAKKLHVTRFQLVFRLSIASDNIEKVRPLAQLPFALKELPAISLNTQVKSGIVETRSVGDLATKIYKEAAVAVYSSICQIQ